jgi:hypothetical protein
MAFARSAPRICALIGSGCTAATRRGSVATSLPLESATGSRKSSTEGSAATLRKLRTIAKALRNTGRIGPTPSLNLKPGARLVREWHGRTYTVTVTEDGFKYGGTSYPSLTKIAKKITGAQWSGPRFFGLPTASACVRRGSAMAERDKAQRRPGKRIRCVIYTRKSSDEGLE